MTNTSEYTLTAIPSSPGYDWLAVGSDVPVCAKRAYQSEQPVTVGKEAADIISAWLEKYKGWPPSRRPLLLAPPTAPLRERTTQA